MSNDSYVARTSVGLMSVNYNGGITSRMPVVFSQMLAPRSPGMFTQDFQQSSCRADASPSSGSLTSASPVSEQN
ncbi:hypothetical protein E4U26_006334 [Claviceps purpurea]|nr:hypothetical protein E4U26_006334 [Claviceps purpurea]KAG6271267.1 hypothetical protein E4U49_004400 [Claviceps purpurea]KAG6304957.1 hypothetical protein E4U45_000899 [Claviceps purpurea]